MNLKDALEENIEFIVCPFYKTCAKGNTCAYALTPKMKHYIKKYHIMCKIYLYKPVCYINTETKRYGTIVAPRNTNTGGGKS